jgi:hypothetical protein
MMRVGLFKPVHVKTLIAQEQRMLLTTRKMVYRGGCGSRLDDEGASPSVTMS